MHLRIRIVLRSVQSRSNSALKGGARSDGRQRVAIAAVHVFILTQLIPPSSAVFTYSHRHPLSIASRPRLSMEFS